MDGERRRGRGRAGVAARLALAMGMALAAAGCLELETTIRLNEDGSGTVTERVRFSRDLLDTDRTGATETFEALLAREGAERRAASMGKGVRLASHEVRDAAGVSRESLSVYEIPDLRDLRYPSVMLGARVPAWDMQIKIEPLLGDMWQGWRAGLLMARFEVCQPPPAPAMPTGAVARGTFTLPPGPAGRQVYRDLTPAFREMMKGLRLRVNFECYTRIPLWQPGRGVAGRGHVSPNAVTLLNFGYAGDTGNELFDSEEVLTDLLLFHLSNDAKSATHGPFLSGHLPWNYVMQFAPSKPLFDKYFEGKTLVRTPGGRRIEVKASFAEIGSHSPEDKRKARESKP